MRRLLVIALVVFNAEAALSQNPIPNPGFETWANQSPSGWTTNNDALLSFFPVSQSSDAQEGSSAALVGTGTVLFVTVTGVLGSEFPVSEKYTALTGYYKFTQVGTAYGSITITLMSNFQPVAQGTIVIDQAASSYTPFVVPISYLGDLTPNTATIQAYIADQTLPAAGNALLLDNLSLTTTTDAEDEPSLPEEFALLQNYPNPFNPATSIAFRLPATTFARLTIVSMTGELLATLHEGVLEGGTHRFTWDASRVASGTYFYRLQAGSFVETRSMLLLR